MTLRFKFKGKRKQDDDTDNTLKTEPKSEDVPHTSHAVLECHFVHCSHGLGGFDYNIQDTGDDISRPPQCTP